jgi:hypothetical protein
MNRFSVLPPQTQFRFQKISDPAWKWAHFVPEASTVLNVAARFPHS